MDTYDHDATEARQASFRAIHDGDPLTYNGDAMAAMAAELEAEELPVPDTFNGVLAAWLRYRLDSDNGSLPGLIMEWSAAEGGTTAGAVGKFDPSAPGTSGRWCAG